MALTIGTHREQHQLMRRILASVLLLLAASSTASAGEGRPRRGAPPFTPDAIADPATAAEAARRGYILTSSTVSEVVQPWTDAVRECWLRHASPRARTRGDLRIDVIIAPTGLVWQHAIVTTGQPGRRLRRCVSDVVAQWRFPMRRAFTSASVPFLFVARGGGGPYKSCWNPRGCPTRRPHPQYQPPRP